MESPPDKNRSPAVTPTPYGSAFWRKIAPIRKLRRWRPKPVLQIIPVTRSRVRGLVSERLHRVWPPVAARLIRIIAEFVADARLGRARVIGPQLLDLEIGIEEIPFRAAHIALQALLKMRPFDDGAGRLRVDHHVIDRPLRSEAFDAVDPS